MLKVGFIGWRGMVGSVLMQRMMEEYDFALIEPQFFTTSQIGGAAPNIGKNSATLKDAKNIADLSAMDAIISCQGGDYTAEIFPQLRTAGWKGHWIDAASTLRMEQDAVIILDPVNMHVIQDALHSGGNNWVGGNCTVSLMLMALNGLFKADLIEWVTSMTYQAASGAGAQHMRELLNQMGEAHFAASKMLADPASAILDIDRAIAGTLRDAKVSNRKFGVT